MQRLFEVSRQSLLKKSKTGDSYSIDRSKGKNRYERRSHSKILRMVKYYNDINMNLFFKDDILTIGVPVVGESSNYIVRIKFGGILNQIQQEIKANKGRLEYKVIVIAVTKIFNAGDVYVHCTCPDFKYRFNYWATKNKYNSGRPENRAANITNPNDSKGAGCKHSLLVLGNIEWMLKLSSTINNYIKYMKEHEERKYADIIFPKLFGMKYDKAIQLGLFDTDNKLNTSKSTINIANKMGKERTKFKPGNPYRFKKSPGPSDDQITLDLDK